jgi:type I restriction enzyme S subunit
MEKQKNIPVLRFPEFEGEWEKKKVKDLVEIKYGKDQKQIVCDNGKYPIMGTGGEMGRTNVFLYDKPSVMIGRKGTIDKPRFMDTPFWTVDTLFYTEVFDNTNAKWLYYKFETINWYLYNEASGVPSLSSSTIYSISIKTPTLPEQKKIATFFTAIDQKISQLKKKQQLLEHYKKGVMQKIFSQHIRFIDDDGTEFPKWTEKRLGDLGSIRMCKRIFTEQTQEIGEVPFYKIGTVGGVADAYITKELFTQYKTKYNYPKKGQTLITCSGTVGKCVQFDGHDSYYQDSNIIWIDNSDENVLDDFLYILLSNYKWGKLNSTTITRIYTNDLKVLKFQFPWKTEQTKIANFLSAIDDKIQHTQRQIEQAEQWKKGLMQKMFV